MKLFRSSMAFTGDIHRASHEAALISTSVTGNNTNVSHIETCQSTPLSAANNITRFQATTGSWHEIVTPTCNYRMGVYNMGFTVATFAKDGKVDVAFLWLPGRFSYLALYLLLSIFAIVQYVYFHFGMGKEKLKTIA